VPLASSRPVVVSGLIVQLSAPTGARAADALGRYAERDPVRGDRSASGRAPRSARRANSELEAELEAARGPRDALRPRQAERLFASVLLVRGPRLAKRQRAPRSKSN